MSLTVDGARLTSRHHRQQVGIRSAATRDLQRLWSTVDPLNLSGTIGRFAEAGAAIVTSYNRESAEVGGRYFRAFRFAEGIGWISLPDITDAPLAEVSTSLLRGAGLSGIVNARRAGFSPQAAARNGFVKAAGTATKLILNGGRGTIMHGIADDGEALGWQRKTGVDPCPFCIMLAARGPVYSASTVDFEPHDHDVCEPEPLYEGSKVPPTTERLQKLWDQAGGDLNSLRRHLSNT